MMKFMNLAAAVAILIVGMGAVASAQVANQRPSQAKIDFAKGTAQLLQNEIIAALLQEFNETTTANAAQGKIAISLIFDNANPAIRLIGNLAPLDRGNLPRDSFERTALNNAVKLNGTPFEAVEQSQDGNNDWFYRRSIPLSNFHPACVICHTNFGPQNPNEWVGALTLRVPNSELMRTWPYPRSAPRTLLAGPASASTWNTFCRARIFWRSSGREVAINRQAGWAEHAHERRPRCRLQERPDRGVDSLSRLPVRALSPPSPRVIPRPPPCRVAPASPACCARGRRCRLPP